MKYPKVESSEVMQGSFLVIKFFPFYKNRGIVAARILETYDNAFAYENLPMGVQGEFEFNEALVGLPQEFQPPLSNDFVHSVGGVYIPKEKEIILPSLSADTNYRRSLEGLKDPDRMITVDELQKILQEE